MWEVSCWIYQDLAAKILVGDNVQSCSVRFCALLAVLCSVAIHVFSYKRCQWILVSQVATCCHTVFPIFQKEASILTFCAIWWFHGPKSQHEEFCRCNYMLQGLCDKCARQLENQSKGCFVHTASCDSGVVGLCGVCEMTWESWMLNHQMLAVRREFFPRLIRLNPKNIRNV